MEINKYPDETSYVQVENIGRDFKTFKINTYEDLWYLNQTTLTEIRERIKQKI